MITEEAEFIDFSSKPSGNFSKKPIIINKQGNPLVSVVTSVYNTGEVLLETARSVFSQSLLNFEWIIVDDGSENPETKKILTQLVNTDERVRIVSHEKNKGLSAGRNTGIESARADYIFLIDSDDLIESTALEKFFLFLYFNHEYYFVNSYLINFGYKEFTWRASYSEPGEFFDENRGSSMFMARKKLFDCNLFDETIKGGLEDWEFWVRCAAINRWGYTLPEYLIWYRTTDPALRNWTNLDSSEKLRVFGKNLRNKYEDKIAENFVPPVFTKSSIENIKPLYLPDPFHFDRTEEKSILCIFPYLSIGGTDKFNIDLLTALKKEGFRLSIITTLPSENYWEYYYKKITNELFYLAHYVTPYYISKYLFHLIITRKPKIIFLSNSLLGYYLLPIIKEQFPEIIVIDYLHSIVEEWKSGGYPKISSVFNSFIDYSFTSYRGLTEYMLDHGVPQNKVETRYINVDENTYCRNQNNRVKIRSQFGISSDKLVIVFSGRLSKEKQPFVLLNTLKILRTDGVEFFAFIIGDGPLFPEVKSFVSENDLSEAVVCFGNCTSEEVNEFLDAGDVFFLPSEYEGVSLSIYEAMSNSLAIVASNVGGHSELVDSNCGYLVERSDAFRETNNYVEIFKELAADFNKVTQFGINSRKRIMEYFRQEEMLKDMRDKFLKFYSCHSSINNNSPISISVYASLYDKMLSNYQDAEEVMNYYWHKLEKKDQVLESVTELEYYRYEIEKIKSWYHKEYEVLPLWYKRVGHILKVIGGKRKLIRKS